VWIHPRTGPRIADPGEATAVVRCSRELVACLGPDPVELWTMASDGSSPSRLSSSPAEYPSWSPDGSRIAFSLVTAGAVQIGIVGRDGQGERTLTPLTENSELPAWSPDGSGVRSLGLNGSLPAWMS
jgi:hypothetical protein